MVGRQSGFLLWQFRPMFRARGELAVSFREGSKPYFGGVSQKI